MAAILDDATGTVFVGGAGPGHATPETLLLRLANRHGLIAGATGTGKTVTLQTLAESLSLAGVPVFLADVKGDLAGLAQAGSDQAKLHGAFQSRATQIGVDLDYQAFPVTFWDVWGETGHPVRTTPAEMGPVLLSRLMGLTDVQEGVMTIAFRVADQEGLPLLDLADLQAMLIWVGQNAADLSLRYGNVTRASVGAIQRALLVLETEGGDRLFGEPALALDHLIRRDDQGRGMINILSASRLMTAPRLYATFLLWLLSELFEELPELGDPDRPVLAFFFDEAHLLFDDAPKALIDKIEQVARLIRSKGVSIWFVTQSPTDIPDAVLGQLGNRVQHALRAFTAKDQTALRAAAQNYRQNPDFDIAEAIQQVGTGEAVTSFLQPKGVPGVAQRTLIRPPFSQLGPIADDQRRAILAGSDMGAVYDTALDRDSAHEMLARRTAEAGAAASEAGAKGKDDDLFDMPPRTGTDKGTGRGRPYQPPKPATAPARGRSDSIAQTFGKSLARQLGSRTGQALVRGVLGSLLKKRR
ncbi:helicase HerA-like domain-containing protein [Paracoccus nototheniae]|uniref:Helicase HerA-like domain-containing protein n=1 Tax=Paracoccus nototheniae TaxID=2489002 RepID=A0ABW4DZG4_9RHOB|nr:helicase HerA-like domain-containing protein [Paracoccus nototheniae]